MANYNETVEQVCAGIKTRIEELWEQSLGEMLNGDVDEFSDRILAAHKREIADEKRISDAVIQSLRDKKLEKEAEVSALRALVGEMADELSKFHAWEETRALVAKAREVVKWA